MNEDEKLIENVVPSNLSSQRMTGSNSVIDLSIRDLFADHADIAAPCRFRSKSLSTSDYYVRTLIIIKTFAMIQTNSRH